QTKQDTGGSLNDKIRRKIEASLDDESIRPTKWREVAVGFQLLQKDKNQSSSLDDRARRLIEDQDKLESLTDEELDAEIEGLQCFVSKQPEQPPEWFDCGDENLPGCAPGSTLTTWWE